MVTKVTNDVLADNAVSTNNIANLAITGDKIAANTITGTAIANNSIDGTKIALGSDAQGDIMYYNGTDWARLAAGVAGQVLQTNGAAANPSWTSTTWGGTETASANGYVTFPGGIRLQWGISPSVAQDSSSAAINFPIAFTTAVYSLVITPTGVINTSSAGSDTVDTVTVNSFVIRHGGDSFEKYMAAIVRHCPTIVKMCQETNMLLYRGVKENAPAFYASPFTKREPKDSYKDIHNAWNHAMDLMGVKAKRDNSIFTITSRGHASNFGDQVYIVFFRDPFNFTWSDKIKDLVLDWEKAIDMVNLETVKYVMGYVWENEELKKEFGRYYNDKVNFDKNDYPHGDSYDGHVFERYNFRKSFDALKSILPKMPEEFRKFESFNAWVDPEILTKNFGLHFDEDLRGAFESGHEITINANYYAIRLDFEKKVREYLKMSMSNY